MSYKLPEDTCINGEWRKNASIKDSVHGYISIPRPILKRIVDCAHFQRIKGIEQTGMKVLYPGASHDRFSHSLGVYHLGSMGIRSFQHNVQSSYPELYYKMTSFDDKYETTWDRWSIMFWLACLLHDCGHAPFSHTLEFIYDDKNQDQEQDMRQYKHNKLLVSCFDYPDKKNRFEADMYAINKPPCGKAHERMSALFLAMEGEHGPYRENIKDLIAEYLRFKGHTATDDYFVDNLEFMVRMIIGCRYNYDKHSEYWQNDIIGNWKLELQMRNCIISLLNSVLDVDNMDYAIRNTTVSGYENNGVDIVRLVNALTITTAIECEDANFEPGVKLNHAILLRKLISNKDDIFDAHLSGQCVLSSGLEQLRVKGHISLVGEEGDIDQVVNRAYLRTTKEFKAKVGGKGVKIMPPYRPKSREHEQDTPLFIKGAISGKFSGIILGKDDENQLANLFDNASGSCRETRIFPAYHKNALSVLQSAIDASNFEGLWIYAHHITTYKNNYLYVYLLERYAQYLFSKELQSLRLFILSLERKSKKHKVGIAEVKEVNIANARDYIKIAMKKPMHNDIKVRLKNINNKFFCNDSLLISVLLQVETLERIMLLTLVCLSQEENKNMHECGVRLLDIFEEILSYEVDREELALQDKMLDYNSYCISDNEVQLMHDIIAIFDRKKINDTIFHQSNDADLLVNYKNAFYSIQERREENSYKEFITIFKELQSRKYLKAMWKSYAEFSFYFKDWTDSQLTIFGEKVKMMTTTHKMNYTVLSDNVKLGSLFSEIWKKVKSMYDLERLVITAQSIKVKDFDEKDTYIIFNSMTLRLKDIIVSHHKSTEKHFFYFYYKRRDETELSVEKISELIKYMQENVAIPDYVGEER